jgi:hypothetical protein
VQLGADLHHEKSDSRSCIQQWSAQIVDHVYNNGLLSLKPQLIYGWGFRLNHKQVHAKILKSTSQLRDSRLNHAIRTSSCHEEANHVIKSHGRISHF